MMWSGDPDVDNNTNDILTLANNSAYYPQCYMATVPPPLMILNQVLFDCSVKDRDQFDGKNAAERITEEVFDYSGT